MPLRRDKNYFVGDILIALLAPTADPESRTSSYNPRLTLCHKRCGTTTLAHSVTGVPEGMPYCRSELSRGGWLNYPTRRYWAPHRFEPGPDVTYCAITPDHEQQHSKGLAHHRPVDQSASRSQRLRQLRIFQLFPRLGPC